MEARRFATTLCSVRYNLRTFSLTSLILIITVYKFHPVHTTTWRHKDSLPHLTWWDTVWWRKLLLSNQKRTSKFYMYYWKIITFSCNFICMRIQPLFWLVDSFHGCPFLVLLKLLQWKLTRKTFSVIFATLFFKLTVKRSLVKLRCLKNQ